MADAPVTRQPGRKTPPPAEEQLSTRHLRLGWWSIALFGGFGLFLETLHGFKVGAYLDVSNETRRLMWTLAHAHGTLLGLVHIGFAWTVAMTGSVGPVRRASSALTAASILLPGGFFLGGVRVYAGDPGLGIVLVPIGAVLVVFAAVSVAGGR